jgi:hypothetical protein
MVSIANLHNNCVWITRFSSYFLKSRKRNFFILYFHVFLLMFYVYFSLYYLLLLFVLIAWFFPAKMTMIRKYFFLFIGFFIDIFIYLFFLMFFIVCGLKHKETTKKIRKMLGKSNIFLFFTFLFQGFPNRNRNGPSF